jgi:4-diphosphocytidyl-2-C-methyl-D-erythritol kinase
MLLFPNSKINLGLNVLEKRPDGFHNIETIFYPVGLSDALEMIISNDGRPGFNQTGLSIEGNPDENLCVKAYRLLGEDFDLTPVKIHLHKVIPIGAGLGGGSSDGASAIKLLNKLFSLGLSNMRMTEYARKLGSDCSFFIENKPVFAFEKGDHFEPLTVDLSSFTILIVVPAIPVNTKEAYSLVKPSDSGNSFKGIMAEPINQWKDHLQNDFERSVFLHHPRIRQIKQQLYDEGAVFASMSGSGSSVYGIFKKREIPLESFRDCFVWLQ